MSADDAFLNRVWPWVRKAIEYMIAKDGNADGMIEVSQPNTLDASWFGKIALWRCNFVPDIGPFRETFPRGRWYAMAGDAGLVMCTWPQGLSFFHNTATREHTSPKR